MKRKFIVLMLTNGELNTGVETYEQALAQASANAALDRTKKWAILRALDIVEAKPVETITTSVRGSQE